MRLPAGNMSASHFSQSPQANIPRSSFNRSHGYKTTFDAGLLVPVFVDEVLPGDTFNLKLTAFGRMSTPIFPIMDNLYFDTFFFFVPNRLVWEHWEQFNGAQPTGPSESTDYMIPQVFNNTMSGYSAVTNGDLADYMGIPTEIFINSSSTPAGMTFSALPLRCVNLIWNEWFRDENLQDALPVPLDDGPDDYGTNYILGNGDGISTSSGGVPYRGKRYDYFTSCLPWPQKINDGTVVTLPLGSTAPVIPNPSALAPTFTNSSGGGSLGGLTATNTVSAITWQNTPGASGFGEWNVTGLLTDLSAATAATINQLRQAFQLQKLFERDARGGTRYTEIIRAHFGVVSPDARLQRPEYLGGGSSDINVTPVSQTSETGTTPLGTLAAFGTVAAHGHGFTKSFVEHGYIIGFASVRSDYTYQQGLNRFWSRQTRYDFYLPVFSHLGEQAVLNQEIYTQGTTADQDVFGYQEAWAEYRYKPSLITGAFRSIASSTLDSWHLSQDFMSLPTLGPAFIIENPPMSRIEAVPNSNASDFILDCYFQLHCARPMPVYGVPGLIDHF